MKIRITDKLAMDLVHGILEIAMRGKFTVNEVKELITKHFEVIQTTKGEENE